MPILSLPLAGLLPGSPGPYAALLLIGFALGIAGHLIRSRVLVLAGVILIFLGAVLFPFAVDLDPGGSSAPSLESGEGH